MAGPRACPAGHPTSTEDYCDVCGLALVDAAVPEPAAPAVPADPADPAEPAAPVDPAGGACPHCAALNPADALFCEACGYDFTTGTPPRTPAPAAAPAAEPAAEPVAPTPPVEPAPLAPASSGWVAEIWIDPDWYADQESTDPLPSAGVPSVVALRSTSVLVGRTSRSRGIHPDIDLAADNGISRRHCQLTTDGTRWWVEDLGSSNGTYVGTSLAALPTAPVPPGERREIGPDGRVYLGAWTRIVVRRAQPGEV